ncbi:MAG: protein kinase [Lachnospiraceae bacterium]|nr:protein kinase [Lachnospiraceae bacterium]
MNDEYEYCPNCDANLTLQRGYDSNLSYWICRGCGEMLINPKIPAPSDIIWRCDGCGELLNIQDGFSEDTDNWICTECGFNNDMGPKNLFESDDERIAYENNPLLGLSDEEVLKLSEYKDISSMGDRDDIMLIQDNDTGTFYIRKILDVYERSVYDFLKSNHILHMPRIKELYESKNCLIVIEEYIDGVTLEEKLQYSPIDEKETIRIAKAVLEILDTLHNLPKPIVHRDVKPSNIIITPDGVVYLLDMNVAKWINTNKSDDTRYMGTTGFAAPEQVGYGLISSTGKSDIYAVGMLMNVMLTTHFPKEEHPAGRIWEIISRCISLEPDNRYSAKELIDELDALE